MKSPAPWREATAAAAQRRQRVHISTILVQSVESMGAADFGRNTPVVPDLKYKKKQHG